MTIFERMNSWAKRSVTLKVISIAILTLLLLIPSSMITTLINERQNIRDGAIDEVSSKWGSRQLVGGPVLSIPYTDKVQNAQGKTETELRYAHFLPEKLSMAGKMTPEKRSRGIYVVVLYNAKVRVTGMFAKPDFTSLQVDAAELHLQDAFIQVGITDMKGIKSGFSLTQTNTSKPFSPGIVTSDIFSSGVSVPVDLTANPDLKFDFNLDLNGSTALHFLPFGKETQLTLNSSWDNPSFEGAFLPDIRSVTDQGFTATWKVLQLNRNYPQQGIGSFLGTPGADFGSRRAYDTEVEYTASETNNSKMESAFGVKLRLPIDEYQKTLRSAKYDTIFIILTFIVFFFVEVLNKKRIHAIQYLLVGCAIILFYILLLSLSEHITFDYAYLTSCLCILLMVTLYAKAIFKSNFLTLLLCGILMILYGFFYSILQLQDYALLLGSLGLVLILGTIMYLTRNIDWYDMGNP